MSRIKRLLFLYLFIATNISAQTYSFENCIDAWSDHSLQQTNKAQILFDDLSLHHDSVLFNELSGKMESYLKNHDNPRIEVRWIMYKTLWALESGQLMGDADYCMPWVMDAI